MCCQRGAPRPKEEDPEAAPGVGAHPGGRGQPVRGGRDPQPAGDRGGARQPPEGGRGEDPVLPHPHPVGEAGAFSEGEGRLGRVLPDPGLPDPGRLQVELQSQLA